MATKGQPQANGLDFLRDYFQDKLPDPTPLKVERQICTSLLIARAGLSFVLSDEVPSEEDARYELAKSEYTKIFSGYGEETLEPIARKALKQGGPVQAINMSALAIQDVFELESTARNQIYAAAHPAWAERRMHPRGFTERWRHNIARSPGCSGHPERD